MANEPLGGWPFTCAASEAETWALGCADASILVTAPDWRWVLDPVSDGPVRGIAVSRTWRRVVTVGADHSLVIRDIVSGAVVKRHEPSAYADDLRPGRASIVVGPGGLDVGTPTARLTAGGRHALQPGPDGRMIDLESGDIASTVRCDPVACISTDGQVIAAIAPFSPHTVELFDAATGALTSELGVSYGDRARYAIAQARGLVALSGYSKYPQTEDVWLVTPDREDLQWLCSNDDHEYWHLCFSPLARWLAWTTDDDVIGVMDRENSRQRLLIQLGGCPEFRGTSVVTRREF